MKYEYLVFIGRFQPFHNGHAAAVAEALTKSQNLVIMIGSANRDRSLRNPFTYNERVTMIRSCFDDATNSRISFEPLSDWIYNENRWLTECRRRIARSTNNSTKVGIIEYSKDDSSYYLKSFPELDHVQVENFLAIDATKVRAAYLVPNSKIVEWNIISNLCPLPVFNFLFDTFCLTTAFNELQGEATFVEQYKESWKNVPYPVIFSTTDCVVTCSGHVLVIKRRAQPGKGKWALPGGFLNASETLEDGAIRELFEETKIKVPEKVIRGCIVGRQTFDDPHRSSRGRTITTGFHIALPPEEVLPKVRGSDDAEKAKWIPINQLTAMGMFEDHWFIIDALTRAN